MARSSFIFLVCILFAFVYSVDSKLCKKPHERYSICLLGECGPKTCDELGYPTACPSIPGACAGGCICEEGYVRDSKGDCIEKNKCPSCGGDPNAVSGCGNPCGKTCVNRPELKCSQYCNFNGCDCKPGYLLLNADSQDKKKKCVPKKECPKPPQQCGVNEQYYCGTSCPEATCANPTPPTCFNKKCKLGCFCKKGFVRDANNKCVLVEKCPPKCKGPHEIYIDCPAGQCNAKTCKDLIIAPPCPRIIPPCPGGCVCEESYLRDSKGICIKKEQCPSMCRDPNSSWTDCKNACPGTCQNTRPGCVNVKCSAGCQCNVGYVLSKIGGKCVKIETCTVTSTAICRGANQKYDCRSKYEWERCEDRYNSPPLNPGKPKQCRCYCTRNYWRNWKNECVTPEKCPHKNPVY